MIFISKRKFEKEVREQTELELKKFYEARHQEDMVREMHKRMDYLTRRIEDVEDKVGIPRELKANCII